MRIRLRGPSGQSTATLDDAATVETLRKTIETQTSLTNFEIKYGYPPKPLPLEQHPPTKLLTELDVKLNGEQLIVSATKSVSQERESQSTASQIANAPGSSSQHANAPQLMTPSSRSAPKSAAPLALSRKKNEEMNDPPEIWCPDLGGNMVLRIMPDDNSCLFRAVASAVLSDMDAVHELRSIIAQNIQANREKYSKAILDNKDPDAYCRWIQTQDAWGGQIELDILSQHFDIEICSIDVQSLRVDRYNEEAQNRCFIVYSGIHYDTIALSTPGAAPEADVKQFMPPLGDEALPKAIELCKKLQEKHYFTDTAGFSLVCNDCGTALTGEAGALKHAQETGHSNFGEAS
jgi:ubiquitin thioesterase OTU1